MQSLGVLPGYTWSSAYAVSADGSAIAGQLTGTGVSAAFRWTQSQGMQELANTTAANGLSATGSVAVGNAPSGVFVWTAQGGVLRLQSLLGSAVPAGWSLNHGNGISANGLTVVGSALDPTNRAEAWVATLTPEILQGCYANCDSSTTPPVLNVNDFVCFQSLFAEGSSRANCDESTTAPVLNVNDFICFQQKFAAGCP
jgi:hypothetical protein